MTDSIAQDLIQSAFRPQDVANSLRSYDARLARSMARLVPFRDERSYGMDRALVAAGRMFGIGKRETRAQVQGIYRRSKSRASLKVYEAYGTRELRERQALASVPTVDHLCGWVYQTRLCDFLHIFKIGFTTDLDRREKQLGYEADTPVRIVRAEAGTLFEEAFRLLVLGRLHIRQEWFFDPELPITSMPEFLAHDQNLVAWQQAAEANRKRVERGSDPIGALGEVYLAELSNGEAA